MNKYKKFFITIFSMFFLLSWPIKVGVYTFPELIMSKVPEYAGYVFFEHITLITIVKYLLLLLCIVYFIFCRKVIKTSKEELTALITLVTFYFYRIISLFLLNFDYSLYSKINISLDFLLIICLFYIVKKMKVNTEKIIVIVGKLNSIAIFIQVFQYNNMIKSFNDLRIIRFTGLMISPIIVSIIIALSMMVIISRREKNHYIKASLMLIACILTGSRTWIIVIVSYILGGIALNIIYKENGIFINYKKISYKKIFFVNILLIMLTVIGSRYYFIFEQGVQEYYNEMFLKRDYGENSIRNIKRNISINLFKENPIIGKGTGTYPYYQSQLINSKSNPHNIYFELLAENGLIGLLLFITFILWNGYILIRRKRFIAFKLLISWSTVAYTLGMLEFAGMLILILILNSDNKEIVDGIYLQQK